MNPYINNLGAFDSLQGLWYKMILFMPQFIGVLIVLVVGIILASVLSSVVRHAIRLSRIDQLTESTGISKLFADVGITFTFSGLISWIIKWFLVIVVLIAVADILEWDQITIFLNRIALYIPNVLVAVVIMSVGFVVGHFVSQIVSKSAVASHSLPNEVADMLAATAKWAIIIFALLAGLTQLGVATRLIEILFTGIVAALALAFGLGGREHAGRLLSKLEHIDITKLAQNKVQPENVTQNNDYPAPPQI
jgi:hypothetical protein